MTMRATPRIGAVTLVTVIALLAGGCGDDATVSDGDTTSTTGPDATSSTTTSEPATSSSTTSSSTTTSSTTTVPTTPLPDDELPGTVFELAPPAGRVLAVIGVRHDDVLNVRLAPGTDNPVVAQLTPLAADFVASGRARMLTQSIWWEVTTADGIVGWVSSRYTAQIGPTSDLTSQVVDQLGGIPEEETMTDLGLVVAESFRPDDPDMPFEIVQVVLPEVGDLGEITYDVVGLGDDAIQGLRLHVFGQPSESGEGFHLMSVESTDMCSPVRGVSEPSGLCA